MGKSESEKNEELAKVLIETEKNNINQKSPKNILSTRLVRTPYGAWSESMINRIFDNVSFLRSFTIAAIIVGILILLNLEVRKVESFLFITIITIFFVAIIYSFIKKFY